MNKIAYMEYLQSPHWKNLRKEFYKGHERKCVECGKTKNLNLHHLTYERLGRERLDDIVCLCEDCHHKLHKKLDKPKKKKKAKKKRKKYPYVSCRNCRYFKFDYYCYKKKRVAPYAGSKKINCRYYIKD